MYSAQRKKSYFTIACLIIPILTAIYLIPNGQAYWIMGASEASIYPARPGRTPVLDGIIENWWSTSSKFSENTMNPSLDFYMRINGSSAYCLIVVKKSSHTANESVLLLLSNNGTTLTDPLLLIDAKYADINNVTEDRRLVAGEYNTDDDQNITGQVRFEAKNWSVYEFGFKYNNTNPELDVTWTIGNTYRAQIRVGDAVLEDYIDSTAFGIEFGVAGGAGNETINPFDIDVKLLAWISFISISGIYGVIGIFIAISKKKVILVPKARSPDEVEEISEASTEEPSEEQGEEDEPEEED